MLSESDPPTYESEASYLRRLGLLLPGELRRISRDDFNPVVTELQQRPCVKYAGFTREKLNRAEF